MCSDNSWLWLCTVFVQAKFSLASGRLEEKYSSIRKTDNKKTAKKISLGQNGVNKKTLWTSG